MYIHTYVVSVLINSVCQPFPLAHLKGRRLNSKKFKVSGMEGVGTVLQEDLGVGEEQGEGEGRRGVGITV